MLQLSWEDTNVTALDLELMEEVGASCRLLDAALDAWEVRRLLAGKYDALGAVVYIYSGAGGTDAQDWTEMLERMYLGWATSRGFTVTTVQRLAGEEAGLKSVTLEVEVGPARYRSPRHTMPCKSRNKSSKCVSMTWRALGGGALRVRVPGRGEGHAPAGAPEPVQEGRDAADVLRRRGRDAHPGR